MTRQEEMDVIGRILDGDVQLFELLVKENEKIVYNLALRMTGSEQDALDASQDAFLKAFRSLSSFRGDSKFSVWLYRLTANASLDLLRRRSRRGEVSLTEEDGEDDEDVQMPIPDERFCPETELEKKELREAVRRAIAKLPPDFRQALLLREISGLSYEEIGRALALEEGTVKSRIFRARKKLAAILMADGNFPLTAASDGKEAH